MKPIELFSDTKIAIWITLTFFLASISSNFNWNFCTLALNLNEYHCQIQLLYDETFQMSYWRSWLKNFLDLWPKTWILCFEIVIISSLYNLSFAKITYQCLLWSTFMSFQEKLDDLFKLTQSCLWQNSLSNGGQKYVGLQFLGKFYVKLSKKQWEFVYFSVALPVQSPL